MLYDPKWEGPKIKTDLKALVAWLEKQPSKKTYDGSDSRLCLFGQFYNSIGMDAPVCLHGAEARIAFNDPQTMEAALERARKFL